MNNKNTIFLIIPICLAVSSFCFADTHYMATTGADAGSGTAGSPWLTLQYSMAHMSGGDTLIVKDGTYTGASNMVDGSHYPPVGSAGNYTIIKAEHDGAAIFDGENTRVMFVGYLTPSGGAITNAYWQFEGLIWCRCQAYESVCEVYRLRYVKFLRCGAYDAGDGNSCIFGAGTSDYILFENCYAWGSARYLWLSSSSHLVIRNCVGRMDRNNPGNDPVGGISTYGANDAEVQNCIIIDCDQNAYYLTTYGYIGAFTVPSTAGSANRINYTRCIALNSHIGSINTTVEAYDVTFRDCILWDIGNKDDGYLSLLRGIRSRVYNCTFGVGRGTSSMAVASWDDDPSGYTVHSSIVFNHQPTTNGALHHITGSDYNALYGNSRNYSGYSNQQGGVHDKTTTNPIWNVSTNPTGALKYITRVESGSSLSGQGESGVDIGANVKTLIGTPGTLWGETGYNVDTGVSMWPFPNEDLIRTKMRSYSSYGINGARGFCADGQTLTKYIWEYLGNNIPPEIYGSSEPTIITSSLPNGTTGTLYTQTLSVSGGTTPYAWSIISGLLPTGLSLNISTGVISGTPTSEGTYNFTVQVSDATSAIATKVLSIVVNVPDIIPPIISNVSVTNITSSSATITWTSNEASTSQVEYGLTTSYGSQSTKNIALVTSHFENITNLTASTTYHLRVRSSDSANNEAVSGDYTLTTSAVPVVNNTIQNFEDGVLWVPGGTQDSTGLARGWAFTTPGAGDQISIDNIGANGTSHSLKVSFASSNSAQIYFRSEDRATDHMPEAKGANRISFYVRFPADFPIQPLPFRYDTWQFGTYIHDPNDFTDINSATSEADHGIHHYYHRVTIEQVGNGWVKYIFNTQPDAANYGGITVPPDRGLQYYNDFGRFYFHFGTEASGPEPTRPFTIWIDEIKFYYDDGSVGGRAHTGGQDDPGFYGQFFPDSGGTTDTTPPAAISNLSASTGASRGSVNLSWTAPGDDGNTGTASAYFIKYSISSITTDAQFNAATTVANPPTPGVAGSTHNVTVSGLTPGTTYYFAIKTQDEVPNTSALSNCASAVAKSNSVPVLTVIGNKSVNENATLSFTISASDADGDSLTYSASGLPSGASFNTSTRTFSWTPTYSQAGSYSVTFNVSDGNGGTAIETITITVNNVNRAPVLAVIGNKTVTETSTLTFTVSTTDDDGDTLTYSATSLPSGATFNTGTRTFTWTPGLSQAGTYSGVRFTVSDGSLTDYEDITITVNNNNQVPVLAAIGNKTVNENTVLTFSLSATDGDGDTLTYSATGLPSGASLNSSSGAFSWTPSYSQSGSYSVTFSVNDGNGGTDSEAITITVNNVNRAPDQVAIGNKTVAENSALTFTVSATDADSDTLTYSASGLPSGATYSNQVFLWIPSYTQAGSYSVTFSVSDGNGGSDSETITITVTNTNRAPVLAAIGNKSVYAEELVSFIVSATDADGDALAYSASGLPSGATFAAQAFAWTPGSGQTGNYSVTFNVSDGNAGTASETITISVQAPDLQAPYLESLNPEEGEVQVPRNTSVKFHIKDNGRGVDLNTLTLSVQREGDASATNVILNGVNQMSVYGNAVIVSGSNNDYVVSYNPPSAKGYRFYYNQDVAVRVSARDLAGNDMGTRSYAFTTTMLLRGWNVRISHK